MDITYINYLTNNLLVLIIFLMLNLITVLAQQEYVVSPVQVGFEIPSFDTVLSFIIRLFFIVAGLIAVIYLLLGAFAWITSGGDKDAVSKAQQKIQAAVIGLVIIFVVLAIIVVVENTLFPDKTGLGISRPIRFPKLVR